MPTVRLRGEAVRKFIVTNLDAHPRDIARVTAEKFGCLRQAVHKHLQRLVAGGAITREGQTRNKEYRLAPLATWNRQYVLGHDVSEDRVWREDVAPTLGNLPENVAGI